VLVQKGFQYRFFPSDEQAAQLARTFGCARFVYNQALEFRSKAWRQEKKSIGYHDTALKLTEWKKEPEKAFLSEVSSVVLQQSLRNLDTAFTNFFEKRAQYPKYKSRRHRQSVRYATNALVGIDVGVKTLATTSDGEKLENPRPLVKYEKRLQIRQRRLSRKVKDSNNRKKARIRVAKLHAKISDARRDTLQKFTTKIISENQAIYVEGLNVVGMVKNHNLAKHIADAAFGEIFRELEYKAAWYGRTYLALDKFFPSSKLCSSCGHLLDELALCVREWECPSCGVHHDRDLNAAINIKKAGQYLLKLRKLPGGAPGKSRLREMSDGAQRRNPPP
jgi:putative transposase